jgi:hypothetical protein
VVRNRVLFGAAVAGLAASLAGCQPVGYGYVTAPGYAGGYNSGYAAPVYPRGYYGSYGYGGGGCWQYRPIYDGYGNPLGQRWVRLC